MSEALRDLVVSLSLDSNNFSRNLTSINRQVAEAESEFKRAAAGVDNFERSVAGTQAQISSLQQKLVAQRNAVTQYERALEAANTKLSTSVRKNGELKVSLDAAKTRYADLKIRIDQTKAAFQASVKATGDNSEESNRLGLELLDLEDQYKSTGAEVKKLDGQLAASTKSLQHNADAVTKSRTGLNQAHAALKQTESQIRSANSRLATLESAWTKSGNALAAFSKKASAASKILTTTGTAMTRYGTMPILALGAAALKSSISYESAFASVRKTVDATEEEYAQLSQSIKQMSTEVATGADNIAEVTAIAGQLGIQNQYLVDFTRTMIDLGNSTDIAASEGAVSLAQFANVTNMSQALFSNFGAALVDLGNNFATTESAILNMATRLASAGSQVGMTQPQILGFATALSSVGLEAEAGGTAFSKAMIQMQMAVETGSESLSDFSRVAGMTNQQFTALWQSDPSAAIQAFIVGLSGMSEEGITAIGVLEEMGFSEVRLRDTLLRATNASELFAQAQQTALIAWEENTALSAEASKRYATTESKLKNLKNTAGLFAQQLGDDLNPTIQNLIDGAGDLLEKFKELDESQRLQIIKFAAVAAAAGPTLAIFGKASKAISGITGTIGKLMIAVGKAGGGVKGLLTVVRSSPAVWLALGAATVVATVALIDYATGAKAAREAIREMNEQAEDWKNTQAKTIYDTGNDAFARFGLDAADFTGTLDESKNWIARLTETWTDGKAETSEIVKSYVDEFVAGSDAIRDAIKNRKKIQAGLGASDPQNDAYLAQLDAYDKEVERLLKKRQNGFLTEDDQKRLDEVIQIRAQIQFEYTTGDGSGYASIRQGVEAEKARLEAEADGQPVAIGVDLYTDALTAGVQGYAAQIEALNQTYHDQYAAVAAITDKEERDAALKVLNTRHQEALNKAQSEYNALVTEYAPEAFQSEDTQQAYRDLERFKELIAEVQSDGIVSNDEITRMQAFTDTLDEGRLASFLALVAQVNEAGLGDLELGTEYGGIQASDLLGGYDTITDFLKANKGDGFDSLATLFGAAEEEAMRVLVDLGLSHEGQMLKEWLESEHLVTIANVTMKDGLTVSDIPATGSMYEVTLEDGVTVSDVLASGKVASAYMVDGVTADGAADANGQMVYVTLADGATVDDVTTAGLITNASPAGNLRVKIPGTANITEYTVSGDATPPTLNVKPSFDLSDLDKTALDAYYAANPDKKPAIEMEIGLKTGWSGLLLSAYKSGTLNMFGPNGAVIEVTPEILSTISPTDIIRYGADENGQIETDENGRPIIDVIIVPKLGSKETAESTSEAANSTPNNLFSWLGMTDSAKKDAVEVASALTEIERLRAKIAELKETGQASDEEGIPLSDYQVMLSATEESLYTMLADLDELDLSKIATDMAAIIAAMQTGEIDTPEGMTLLDPYIKLLEASDKYLGVGNDIAAGIAEGLRTYGWTTDATTVAKDVESALRGPGAFDSQSPANKTKPIGKDVVAGIGVGMTEADMTGYADQTAARIKTALRAAIRQDTMRGIGYNVMLGLGLGILSGRSFVVAAIQRVARETVATAKRELKIESPSRVFRDEVGRMSTRGLSEGFVLEAKEQEKVIRNASRYLVGAAQGGVSGGIATDNRKTFHYNASSAVNVDKLYVRDEQDVTALAVEIASLTRRRQRGRGRKNA